MRMSWLLCVLLGTLAWGQAAPSAPPSPQQAPATAAPVDTSASVPADAAVITVTGACLAQPKPAAAKDAATKPATASKTAAAKPPATDCKTVITKAQFEKLADNLAPNVTPQLKRQLASVLPRLIGMSNEAKKQGLDKTPQYKKRIEFRSMQTLVELMQQNLQQEAAKVSDEQIEEYYKNHPENYEQYNVDRLFVPRTKQVESELKDEEEKKEKLTEEEQKAKQAAEKAKAEEAEQAMSKLAEDLRGRAAAGEDFAKLQKEAFEAGGMKIESPTVTLPNVRRTGLPPAHAAVLDLKPGEVSQVISDSGGHYIYKVNSKNPMTLDQAKSEIHSKLQNDRQHELLDKLNNSFKVETNEAYFGAAAAGPVAPRMPRPVPGAPPAAPSSAPSAAPAPQPQTPPTAQPPAAKPN